MVEYVKFYQFYRSAGLFCNFPESFLTPVTYFNNITVGNTKIEEVNGQGALLLIFDQGNSTESNID